MKTIEDAVIRFDGLWQECFDVGFAPLGLTRQEFEACAKRMGFVGKYRWGIEYPTNGKRPDLADDVDVSMFSVADDEWHAGKIRSWNWGAKTIVKFRITDPRYKPVDEQEYEPVIITGADIAGGGGGGGFMPKAEPYFPPKKPVDEVSEKPESNWHERGELPPVGVECEMLTCKEWIVVYVVGMDKASGRLVVRYIETGEYFGHTPEAHFYRPIRTHREKVIEAAMDVCNKVPEGESVLGYLYYAGMLVLPQDSGNTKA